MDYKIVEKAAFTVMGFKRRLKYENSYEEIPKFWQEHMNSEKKNVICGMYGVCTHADMSGADFDYYIADNYIPWKDISEGCETISFPSGTWAVFPCTMKTLQDTSTKIWKEWVPNCTEYKLVGYNIEMYTVTEYTEIWVPVEKISL